MKFKRGGVFYTTFCQKWFNYLNVYKYYNGNKCTSLLNPIILTINPLIHGRFSRPIIHGGRGFCMPPSHNPYWIWYQAIALCSHSLPFIFEGARAFLDTILGHIVAVEWDGAAEHHFLNPLFLPLPFPSPPLLLAHSPTLPSPLPPFALPISTIALNYSSIICLFYRIN